MDFVLEAVFGAETQCTLSIGIGKSLFVHLHNYQQKVPHIHHYIILSHSLLYAKKKIKNQQVGLSSFVFQIIYFCFQGPPFSAAL